MREATRRVVAVVVRPRVAERGAARVDRARHVRVIPGTAEEEGLRSRPSSGRDSRDV